MRVAAAATASILLILLSLFVFLVLLVSFSWPTAATTTTSISICYLTAGQAAWDVASTTTITIRGETLFCELARIKRVLDAIRVHLNGCEYSVLVDDFDNQ